MSYKSYLIPEQIGMPQLSPSDLRARLTATPMASSLIVTAFLADFAEFNPAQSDGLVRASLPAPYKDAAYEITFGVDDQLVVSRQHYLALQKALIAFAEGEPAPAPSDIILHSGIQLGGLFRGNIGSPLAFITQSAAFYFTESYRRLIARYWDMFVTNARADELLESPKYIDLDDAFAELAGIPLRTLVSMGFGVAVQGLLNLNLDILRGGQPAFPSVNLEPWFATTDLTERAVQVFRQLTCLDVESAAVDYREQWNEDDPFQAFWWDFSKMRSRPLVPVGETAVAVCSTRFMIERVTSGLYHYYAELLPEERRGAFRTYFGDVYEKYVRRIFHRMIDSTSVLRDLEYDIRYNGCDCSDVLYLEEEDAFFLEVVSMRLTQPALIEADENAVLSFIDRLVGRVSDADKVIKGKAWQLNDRIADFRDGKYEIRARDWGHVRRVYPIIVVLEPAPLTAAPPSGMPTFMDFVDQRVAELGLLVGEKVQPLQIVSCGDLEDLEALVEQKATTAGEAFRRRAADASFRRVSLTESLLPQIAEWTPSRHLSDSFRTAWNEIGNAMFPGGLPAEEATLSD